MEKENKDSLNQAAIDIAKDFAIEARQNAKIKLSADNRTGAAGNVDLREAAKKTVPAVVNVTPVQVGRVYYGSPLDFWFGCAAGRFARKRLTWESVPG